MIPVITLQLDDFEGPLDLLLYLIKKNDLEVSRISISQVTDQYLHYLDSLKELDIDVASEFLFMAAELAHIKSKTILPRAGDEFDEEDENVADDLVSKLMEFERYKMAAQDLKNRPWLHRDVFVRGSFKEEENEEPKKIERKSPEDEDFEVDMFELIKAFSTALSRLPKERQDHEVVMEHVSVTDKIYEILEMFKENESIVFADFFAKGTRMDIVVGFLAVLELAKLKMIKIYQTDLYETIRIQRRLEVSEDILKKDAQLKDLESYR